MDGVIASRDLHRACAHVLVCPAHRLGDLPAGHAEGSKPRRIEQHLILADVAADARHFGHAGEVPEDA